ncbi:T9SS C-terminal target domain-containing protein [Polaribacter sp. WD7]|uniref:T9SS type A sorting domain-containing protein n=1 Tax=Polaribacter sp. WD7 TaxID=2269061 RepID=UPI000DF2CC55|nr:T9SS type A sorting domain-containing protein [Polaribacter sp. WD7]RCS26290.1 T9SS C-terminal target domain-containing protein [Polaribacter sp. WD7]
MKKINLLKEKIFFLLLLTFQVIVSQNNNGSIDVMGDIAIIAVNRISTPSSQSDYAFVLLDDCLAGTKIYFDDDDWTGSAFSSLTGEGVSEWTNNTNKTLGAGTVIRVNFANNNGTTSTTNIGITNEINGGFNLAAGDQLYAYLGAERAPTVFLSFWGETNAINGSETAVLTGTKLSNGGLDLTNGTTARVTANIGYYNGSTDCNGSISDCAAMINGGTIVSGSFTWPTGVKTAFKGSALPNKFFGTTNTNWSTATNWGYKTVPSASDHVRILNVTNNPVINSSTSGVSNNILVDASSTLTINAGGSLTISGNLTQNGTFNILSNASTNGSLIVQGTSTGNVSYLRHVSTNWHLIGAPVEGQSINSLSGEVETNGNNFAIAPYLNSTTSLLRWNYYTTNAGTNDIASSGNFLAAKGYTFKKKTVAGTVTFTGTINTEDQPISITDGGDNPSGNRWNLVANPYTAALNATNAADATNNFLKVNIDAGNLDPTKAGLYLWTGATPYDVKSVDDAAFYIAPGQAFFVHAPDGGGTSVSFTEAMQSHQTGNIFLKNTTSYPEIILNLSGGKSKSLTKIRYIQGKTTGLDVGSDVGTFTGTGKSNFEVYSHLVNSKFEDDFAIQALPNSNFEEMIVPIGVSAKSGQEISFSAALSNLPVGLSVFLEDKENNTLTELSDADRNYSIALNKDLNGTGRFYIHTTSNALSIDNNDDLQNINIYTINTSTLRITGLSVEKNEIVIFNMLGKQVFSTSFIANNVKDINLLNLSAGIYFVQLQNNSGKLTKKIILE